jgi:hypothetical protein
MTDVGEWHFDGDNDHPAGTQRAFEGDVIFDEHVGMCNYVKIVGERPRQMRVVVPSDEAKATLGNTTGERYFLCGLGSIRVVSSALTTSPAATSPPSATSAFASTSSAAMLRFLYKGKDESKRGMQLVYAGDVGICDDIGQGKIVAISRLKPRARVHKHVHKHVHKRNMCINVT